MKDWKSNFSGEEKKRKKNRHLLFIFAKFDPLFESIAGAIEPKDFRRPFGTICRLV